MTKSAPPELPDDLRIPLHELQADARYLVSRVAVDGSMSGIITEAIETKLSHVAEAAYRLHGALLRLSSERDEMVERARKLVDKLDACREPTAAIFAHQYVRTGVQYSGPTYFNELEALRSLLSKPQEGATKEG